jgi:hypothetical protein
MCASSDRVASTHTAFQGPGRDVKTLSHSGLKIRRHLRKPYIYVHCGLKGAIVARLLHLHLPPKEDITDYD